MRVAAHTFAGAGKFARAIQMASVEAARSEHGGDESTLAGYDGERLYGLWPLPDNEPLVDEEPA
jgi:hypothetical protein